MRRMLSAIILVFFPAVVSSAHPLHSDSHAVHSRSCYTPRVPDPRPVSLFFAFPDGVFHYVCAECNALCCRGQGFGGNVEREMGFLLKTYPGLSALVTMRHRDLIDISTPLGRCFFLQDDNRCRIQAEHGSSKKPGVCLVFPFNRFTRVGTTVFVTPHFMCPLRVETPASPGRVSGTHAVLDATIRESAMLDPKYVEWYLSAAKLPEGETAKETLARQSRFRETVSAAIGRERFIDLLVASGGDRKDLAAVVKRTTRLMGWAPEQHPSGSRDSIDDVMIALAQPLLIGPKILPHDQGLRVLALSERFVRTVFSPGLPAPQPQAIHSVIQQVFPVLRMLTSGDEKPKLPRKTPKPQFGQPDLVFAHFMLFRDLKRMGTFPALEIAFKKLKSPADRTALANHLAAFIR